MHAALYTRNRQAFQGITRKGGLGSPGDNYACHTLAIKSARMLCVPHPWRAPAGASGRCRHSGHYVDNAQNQAERDTPSGVLRGEEMNEYTAAPEETALAPSNALRSGSSVAPCVGASRGRRLALDRVTA
jgi:hypothetical protein